MPRREETRGGHLQRTYAEPVAEKVNLSIDQIVGPIRQFVKGWESEKMEFQIDIKQEA